MSMRMTLKSYNNMNALISLCFNANAVIDNLAYNLDYHYQNEIGKIVHLNVAHVMPEWADQVSDKMLELSGRPVRSGLVDHIEEYKDLKEIFMALYDTFMQMRELCRAMIEEADMQGDDEVRIFGEEFLDKNLSPFIKQAEEWIHASEILDANSLNIHIKEYTHFIEV